MKVKCVYFNLWIDGEEARTKRSKWDGSMYQLWWNKSLCSFSKQRMCSWSKSFTFFYFHLAHFKIQFAFGWQNIYNCINPIFLLLYFFTDMFRASQKKRTTTSDSSSKDNWCYRKNYISLSICCVSDIFLHTLQGIFVENGFLRFSKYNIYF